MSQSQSPSGSTSPSTSQTTGQTTGQGVGLPNIGPLGIELRWLESFLVVAEEMHFSRAARRLHLTQPALTSQIHRLERAVGSPLFERTNRMKGLTAVGRALLPEARDLLRRARRFEVKAHRAAQGESGILRLGVIPPGTLPVLADAIRDFQAAFPEVDFTFRVGNQSELITALKDRELDLVFCRPGNAKRGTTDRRILTEEQGVILRRDDPLAQAPRIPLAELDGRRLLLLRGNPYFGRLLLSHGATHGVQLSAIHEAQDFPSLHWMVRAGLGIAPCSLLLADAISPDLIVRPLEPAPDPLHLAFCWIGPEPSATAGLWMQRIEDALVV